MLQQRVSDPTGTNRNGVWVSPMRDIAHCMPVLVRRAIEAAELEVQDDSEATAVLSDYAVKLAKFINECVGENSPAEVAELFKRIGLLDASAEVQALVGKWLTRVMLGMYFTSVKEATHPGEKPIGVDTLLALPIISGAADR